MCFCLALGCSYFGMKEEEEGGLCLHILLPPAGTHGAGAEHPQSQRHHMWKWRPPRSGDMDRLPWMVLQTPPVSSGQKFLGPGGYSPLGNLHPLGALGATGVALVHGQREKEMRPTQCTGGFHFQTHIGHIRGCSEENSLGILHISSGNTWFSRTVNRHHKNSL